LHEHRAQGDGVVGGGVPGGRSAVFARAVGHRPPTPSARRLSLFFQSGWSNHPLSLGSRARRLPPAENRAKSMRGRVARVPISPRAAPNWIRYPWGQLN
jgi:hypothetical protein